MTRPQPTRTAFAQVSAHIQAIVCLTSAEVRSAYAGKKPGWMRGSAPSGHCDWTRGRHRHWPSLRATPAVDRRVATGRPSGELGTDVGLPRSPERPSHGHAKRAERVLASDWNKAGQDCLAAPGEGNLGSPRTYLAIRCSRRRLHRRPALVAFRCDRAGGQAKAAAPGSGPLTPGADRPAAPKDDL